MIRYSFINNQVLQIYSKMESISFPIDPENIVHLLPNCRYLTYQKMAEISNSTLDEIIQLCESASGCTHYDITQKRYLILCNQDTRNNNNRGRQRWTCSHEIGHIICNHHVLSAYDKLAENSLLQVQNPEFEAEADYFAATLLAPFPLFDMLGVRSGADVQKVFGLSAEAAQIRYTQFIKWKRTRIKSAWENDIIRLYRRQSN